LSNRIPLIRAAQTLKELPVKNEHLSPGPTRPTRDQLPGPAMVCSLWDSLQGSRVHLLPDPANQLPLSLFGQAPRPPGGSTAPLQLPKSSTRHPSAQPPVGRTVSAQLRLGENTNGPLRKQAYLTCGSLWKGGKSREQEAGTARGRSGVPEAPEIVQPRIAWPTTRSQQRHLPPAALLRPGRESYL
jgi:hypothetical protein